MPLQIIRSLLRITQNWFHTFFLLLEVFTVHSVSKANNIKPITNFVTYYKCQFSGSADEIQALCLYCLLETRVLGAHRQELGKCFYTHVFISNQNYLHTLKLCESSRDDNVTITEIIESIKNKVTAFKTNNERYLHRIQYFQFRPYSLCA